MNGGYLSQPAETGISDGGQAAYWFDILTAGSYVISANVNSPDTTANSFYVNIDGQPTGETMTWDVPVGNGFVERFVSWRGNGNMIITSMYRLFSISVWVRIS